MKKLIWKLFKLGTGIVVFILLFLIITNHFWPQMYRPEIKPPLSSIVHDFGIGPSMEPTMADGGWYDYDTSIKYPKIGDIVVFRCFTEICQNGDELHGKIKRLAKINDQGCYWFEGDNPDFSWDSRNYGWLCSPDVKILGVVIKIYPQSDQKISNNQKVQISDPPPTKNSNYNQSNASGCCSHHGGICGCNYSTGKYGCCDGADSPSCFCSQPAPPTFQLPPSQVDTSGIRTDLTLKKLWNLK